MKIDCIDENNIIVFLNKLKITEKLLLSNVYLENYFQKLFLILKNKYGININGYYNVTLYQDKVYGVIVDIKKEFTDYFDYLENQVDMRIDVSKDSTFLYKLKSYSVLGSVADKLVHIYLYNGNIYLKPKKNIGQINLGFVFENSVIVYGEETTKVLKLGKIIKSKYVFV